MSATAKLAAFAAALAAALGLGAAVGAAAGPIDTAPARHEVEHQEAPPPRETAPTAPVHQHTHGWSSS